METKTLVHDAVQRGFEQLEEVDLSSDDYKTCVEGLTELVDREIEISKVEADAEFKTKQAKDEKVDRIVKNVLTGSLKELASPVQDTSIKLVGIALEESILFHSLDFIIQLAYCPLE